MDPATLERGGRDRFHLALAGGLTLCLFPFISWWFAMNQPSPDPTGWRRRLILLAALDTLLFAAMLASSGRVLHEPKPTTTSRPKIGVQIETIATGGVTVKDVSKGLPAEQAGILVGDRIVRVDDAGVVDRDQFIELVAQTPPGTSRDLQVRRGDRELPISVTPIVPPKRGPSLFESSSKHDERTMSARDLLESSAGPLTMLVGLGIVAFFGARRRAKLKPIWIAMGALAAHAVVSIVTSLGLAKVLGSSLVGLVVGGLAMLGVGILAMRSAEPVPPPAQPLGTLRAVLLGILYAVAGSIRAGMLVVFVTTILHVPNRPAVDVFGVSTTWGPGGIALFVIAAVVIAPIAEECLFRGVLLPWLLRWTSPTIALVVSAAIFGIGHLFYGASVLVPFVYGLALGALRLRTGRLRASMILHGVINGVATAAMLWVSSR